MNTHVDNYLAKIEYQQLQGEILNHSERIDKIITFAGTAIALIVGYVVQVEISSKVEPFIYLYPFFIIIPSISMVASSLNSTVRIATYISVFYESTDSNNPRWQSRLQSIRENKQDSKTHRKLGGALELLLIGMSLICVALSTSSALDKYTMGDWLYWIFLMVIYIFVVRFIFHKILEIRNVWLADNFDKLKTCWLKIKIMDDKDA
ncbi:MAG: hypothetical protein ACXVA2_14900 [Mucilaginibacter sp.]